MSPAAPTAPSLSGSRSRVAVAIPPPRPRMTLRPTRHALVFFLILGAMFIASINYQSNAAWLMVFLVACTGAMSAVHGWRNAAPAEVAAGDPPLVQAGERTRIPITVHNPGGRDLLALVIEVPADQHPDGETSPHRLLVPRVPARGSARADLLLAPFPRGRHQIARILVSTQYPLGLFRAVRRLPVALVLHIHPVPLGMPLAQSRTDPEADAGAAAGRSSRMHEDFRGLRPWHQGESYRHVDWKAAARGNGALQVKEFAGGGTGTTWLTWLATVGDDETRLSQLAKWVIEAHVAGLTFGLAIPGREIEPASGAEHQTACLRALADYVPPLGSSARRVAVGFGPRPGSSASVSGEHRIQTGKFIRKAPAP